MSKKEKEQRIKDFWKALERYKGSLRYTKDFFLNDDCPVPDSNFVIA